MIRTSFSSLYTHPSVSPFAYVYISATRDADVAERREHFSLFCHNGISSFLPGSDSLPPLAFLMSYLATPSCEVRIAGFVRAARRDLRAILVSRWPVFVFAAAAFPRLIMRASPARK